MASHSRTVHRATFSVDRLVFPEPCLECDGTCSREGTLSRETGGVRLDLPAPLCDSCMTKRRVRRTIWHLAWVGAMVAFVVLVTALQTHGFADQHGWIMLILVASFAGTALWWSQFKEYDAYHRRFSRIWIDSFGNPAGTVTLATSDV